MIIKRKNNIKTAKDILAGHDFFTERQLTEKYIHHEFQDYAYRIASELGDLQHKPLYMRLAKTVPRHYLERALAFTGDYKDRNKGKLFMWKLKQLREEAQLLTDNQNFDYDFIWKRTGKLYDELSLPMLQKYAKTRFEIDPLLTQVAANLPQRKLKGLVLDSFGGYVSEMLSATGVKLESFEISKNMTEAIKPRFAKTKRSQFTLGKYESDCLDIIWCQSFWGLIPLEKESEFITEFGRLLRPRGLLQIRLNLSENAHQEWEVFTLSENNYYRLVKTSAHRILELFSQKFEIISSEDNNYLLRRLLDQDNA